MPYAILFILTQFVEFRTNFSFFSGNSKQDFFIQDQLLFPAYEGFRMKKGFNIYNSVYFYLSSPESDDFEFKLVAEPFFSYPQDEPIFLHRFSSKVRYKFFALEGGKDTLSLGPGIHNSLLLSHNIAPQNFISPKIESLRLPCIGKFCPGAINFMTAFIFADDDNYKFPDPTFWAMSFSWDIWAFRFGASRIIGFGGKGGWKPKTFKDWLDLFTAKYENASGVCDLIQNEEEKKKCYDYWTSKDTNQVAEVFGVIRISEILETFGVYNFGELGFYFEYGGDDIVACWQVEDIEKGLKKSCFPSPFGFTDAGWVVGLWAIIHDFALQIEYTWFNKIRKFYSHGNYPMVVQGRYLGAHTGPLSDDVWIKIVQKFYGFYAGASFHYTSRWKSPKEEIFEVSPKISFDLDDGTKTFGFSPSIYIIRNPDKGTNPFEPDFRRGKFVDFSLSFVFISRF